MYDQVEEAGIVTSLLLNGQEHIFKNWPAPGQEADHKAHLLKQLVTLNEQYDGGLAGMNKADFLVFIFIF
jgi:UDP-sugar pyrophosphorylase